MRKLIQSLVINFRDKAPIWIRGFRFHYNIRMDLRKIGKDIWLVAQYLSTA
jgi:hypothetical protein